MKGWHKDNYRHSLAARGVKTSFVKRVNFMAKEHLKEDKTKLEEIYAYLDRPGNSHMPEEVLVEELQEKFPGLTEGRAEALVERHRKCNFAVVGFSPETKDRILRILSQNPQLKSKIMASTRDIVAGTSDGARAANVSNFGQVWWITPEQRAGWQAAVDQAMRWKASGLSPDSLPDSVKETIADIPGHFFDEKISFLKRPERSQPWTIYLTNLLDKGAVRDPYYKFFIEKYGLEQGKDEYIRALLEHEVTHLAHGEKIPDFVPKMFEEREGLYNYLGTQTIPVSEFKKEGIGAPHFSEILYISEPTEQLARKHTEKLIPGLRRQRAFEIVVGVSPKLIERRKVWEEMLKASPTPKLRALPRKWEYGEGEEERFEPVSPEEASVNLSYLE